MAKQGRVAGKHALVTGAGQGIGAAVCKALAVEGAQVAVTDVDGENASAVATAINADHGEGTAFAMPLDVTKEEQWIEAVARVRSDFGKLSVLVNNAGIMPLGTVESLDYETWRLCMAINADGPFLGCKHALPLMKESQPGSIVNMSSVSGMIATHNMAAYNASKAALWLFSKSVALHCARGGWDIRSNTIHPVFIRTPMLDVVRGKNTEDELVEKLARQVPIGRIGEVEDIANAVIYLASEESRMMTGSELKLDGGLTAM